MIKPIEFYVAGIPKPAGSKRGFPIRKGGVFTGRVAIVDACKGSHDWKIDVKHAAAAAWNNAHLLDGPLRVVFTFHLTRPKGHFRTGANSAHLRDAAPNYPAKKPDLLKLARAIEDAMTGIVWVDDAQIVTEILYKRFASQPGVTINVSEEML